MEGQRWGQLLHQVTGFIQTLEQTFTSWIIKGSMLRFLPIQETLSIVLHLQSIHISYLSQRSGEELEEVDLSNNVRAPSLLCIPSPTTLKHTVFPDGTGCGTCISLGPVMSFPFPFPSHFAK